MTTPENYADGVAAAVRAELGRQRKTQVELAQVLGLNPGTVSSRCNGHTPFNVLELMHIAIWLNVPVEHFAGSPRIVNREQVSA